MVFNWIKVPGIIELCSYFIYNNMDVFVRIDSLLVEFRMLFPLEVSKREADVLALD